MSAYEADTQKDYPNVSYIVDTDEVVWQKTPDYSKQYLTFVAEEDGTFRFSGNSISYSLDDGTTWTELASDTDTPTIAAGSKIMWKANGLTPTSTIGIGRFTSSGRFYVEGNIMSLVSGDSFSNATTVQSNQFNTLFGGATGLTSAQNLVLTATTLAKGCYYGIFSNCRSLTTAPELPATTLASDCYQNMFASCFSLTTAPELPATTLASSCYDGMFAGCRSLTTAPELPATTLASACYQNMFSNCTSLTTAPELPATTLASACYRNMFQGCTSLTTAPELPATTLVSYCYQSMFSNCTSLTTAPELPSTTLTGSCYTSMFNGCSSLTTAPELPATTLAMYSYYLMFGGCTSLNSITCLATDISADGCLTLWLYGVASTGTFTKASSMTGWTTGDSGIPTGWIVQDYSA